MDLKETIRERELETFGSGRGQVECSCEHGNELTGSIKCGGFS